MLHALIRSFPLQGQEPVTQGLLGDLALSLISVANIGLHALLLCLLNDNLQTLSAEKLQNLVDSLFSLSENFIQGLGDQGRLLKLCQTTNDALVWHKVEEDSLWTH